MRKTKTGHIGLPLDIAAHTVYTTRRQSCRLPFASIVLQVSTELWYSSRLSSILSGGPHKKNGEVNMTARTIFAILALIVFVLAAFGVAIATVDLLLLGLAFLAAAHIEWHTFVR